MDLKFRTGEIVFDHWRIKSHLGHSDYGEFYELSHAQDAIDYPTQLKVVSVPRNLRDLVYIQSLGNQATQYVDSVIGYVMEEISLHSKLHGNPHILHYYDHKREMHPNGLGCDILIRTEHLPTVDEYAQEHSLTQGDIIRLGIEICSALEDCHNHDIIHRNIHPDCIFVTQSGSFKLGNFAPSGDLPQEDLGDYAAPELYRGEKYDHTVDLYSLALVMYRLLNKGKIAFTPESRGNFLYNEPRDIRLSGATVPLPFYGKKGRLGKIICRAASAKVGLRYSSARAFREELQHIKKVEGEPIYPFRLQLRIKEVEKTSLLTALFQ